MQIVRTFGLFTGLLLSAVVLGLALSVASALKSHEADEVVALLASLAVLGAGVLLLFPLGRILGSAFAASVLYGPGTVRWVHPWGRSLGAAPALAQQPPSAVVTDCAFGLEVSIPANA